KKGAGTSMLEDGIFVRDDWIKDKKNQATATKFLTASFKGWIYCRDHWRDCVNIVLTNGPALPRGHQTWQMKGINAPMWPAPKGIGIMDKTAFARTARIAKQFGVIKKSPSGAYRDDLAKAAVATLKRQGVDVYGRKWKKAKVTVTPGGKSRREIRDVRTDQRRPDHHGGRRLRRRRLRRGRADLTHRRVARRPRRQGDRRGWE